MRIFEDELEKFKNKHAGHEICLSGETVEKIERFVSNVIEMKSGEAHHRIDGSREFTRFYTGTLGEVAIENFLQASFVDWTVGESAKYHTPDLGRLGIAAGIKTVEYGKFPLIFKNSQSPEIINIKLGRDKVLILGVATTAVLQKCQDDMLVLSPALRRRGTKTGFYGFDELQPFDNIEQLKEIVARDSRI